MIPNNRINPSMKVRVLNTVAKERTKQYPPVSRLDNRQLTMDDALNSAINNMVYNNRKCIELHLPVEGTVEDYNWRIKC